MTPTPAIEVRVQTATTMATMKPIERPANRFSSRMPMTAKTAAMIATYLEMKTRSDGSMPPGRPKAQRPESHAASGS